MNPTRLSRRSFVRTCGGAALVLSASPSFAQASGPVRKNLKMLDENSSDVVSLTRAVQAMKALPVSNPLSWSYQANIHGVDPCTDPHWCQCPHHNRYFLMWHRAYLYYFERIVRKMSGDAGFALPYWAWDDSTQASVPAPFLNADSTLFAARDINDGSPIYAGAELTAFLQEVTSALAEGGFDVSSTSQGFSEAIATPHDEVHSQVGGLMGVVQTSANDPLFWVHHSNVDRQWAKWQSNPAQLDPTDNDYQQKTYTFFDADGSEQTHTFAQFAALTADVRYSDVPAPAFAAVAEGARRAAAPPVKLVASATKDKFKLGKQRLQLDLAVPEHAVEHVMAALPEAEAAARPTTPVLKVQGVEFEPHPNVHYRIYLLPRGKDPQVAYLVSTLTFFGREEHGDHAGQEKFDLTINVAKQLAAAHQEQGLQSLQVVFVPVANGSRKLTDASLKPNVSFERAAIELVPKSPDNR